MRCFLVCVLTVLIIAVCQPAVTGAELPLLSHFKLNGDGQDALGNSPPIMLSGVQLTNGTLVIPETDFPFIEAAIPSLSYQSFTVAFDFRPRSFLPYHWTLLSGGPSYRWIGFENDAAGHFLIRLNNGNHLYQFTNVITTNLWHTLICSVSLPSQKIMTFLDGQRLLDIFLSNFQFEVVGTPDEASDKVFSFRNYGNASTFFGEADNLRVFSRALTLQELQAVTTVKLSIQHSAQNTLISWPGDLTGYVPEVAESLVPPVTWRQDARTPLEIGGQRVLIDSSLSGSRFFRLRRSLQN